MTPAARFLAPLLVAELLACADPGSCFVRGSRVVVPGGFRAIEDLRVGDQVLSYDTEREAVTVRRVVRVMRRLVERVVTVQAGEIAIAGASPEHPVWDAAARAFRPIAALGLESRLLVLLPGANAPRDLAVDRIAVRDDRGPIEVWNLEVEVDHTYFVEGILVHNKDCCVDSIACGDVVCGYEQACILGPGDCGRCVDYSGGPSTDCYECPCAPPANDPSWGEAACVDEGSCKLTEDHFLVLTCESTAWTCE
jgi:hypothetical protein